MQKNKVRHPISAKMVMVSVITIVPFLAVIFYLLASMLGYTQAYDSIVNNMTIANNYNLNFKENMDESMYKLVVSTASLDKEQAESELQSPYGMIEDIREQFENLLTTTRDGDSRVWVQSLLRNVDTLENRVDDIQENLGKDGTYDENIEMLENNIYIMTELIQDDIQYYIYYQARNIDRLKDRLNDQVQQFIRICIVMVLLVAAVVILLTILMVRSIVVPVQDLCHVTEEISEGNLAVRARKYGQDELGDLSLSVNDMAENIQSLVEKTKEDERKMRWADLRLLQEQINPHFLYNTLDTIVWLIEGNDNARAVNMVVSLSEFFRLVLSKGKEYISIRDEEQHIRSYLEIQQVRYQDILDYEIEIDPQIYDYQILKLTLQPLVENSLYHGIKYKRARGCIRVTGSLQGENILLQVEDNGVGMEPEDLEQLRQEIQKPCQETERGFGLANVNERIRMNFGAQYGMTIDSEKGVGTRVQVTIPAVMYKKAQKSKDEDITG